MTLISSFHSGARPKITVMRKPRKDKFEKTLERQQVLRHRPDNYGAANPAVPDRTNIKPFDDAVTPSGVPPPPPPEED